MSPSPSTLRARVVARWHGLLRRVVQQQLSPRQALLPPALVQRDSTLADARALALELDRTRRQLQAVSDDLALWGQPFRPDMTVDQAWRRHPGTAAVFARHHLPACDGCAVRFDETLEEAAQAYGLDLGRLMEELASLLGGSSSSVG